MARGDFFASPFRGRQSGQRHALIVAAAHDRFAKPLTLWRIIR
jgi:hypothetical protein